MKEVHTPQEGGHQMKKRGGVMQKMRTTETKFGTLISRASNATTSVRQQKTVCVLCGIEFESLCCMAKYQITPSMSTVCSARSIA